MTLKGLATAWVVAKSERDEAKAKLEEAQKRYGVTTHKLACVTEDLLHCGELLIVALDEGYVLVRKSHGVELVPKEPAE